MQTCTTDDARALYAPGSGRHWFDADSMRFFRTRLCEPAYRAADGSVYFVSSERDVHRTGGAPRAYSVRQVTGPGSIRTVGGFQAYASRSGAMRAALRGASDTRDVVRLRPQQAADASGGAEPPFRRSGEVQA